MKENTKKQTLSMPAPPELPEKLLPGVGLQSMVENALRTREDVMERSFENENLEAFKSRGLEFSACTFQCGRWQENEMVRTSFVDCILDHVDLSNEIFQDATFQRVVFTHCRMTGVGFEGCNLMNVAFDHCQMEYASFSNSKLDRSHFQDCRIRESIWDHVQFSRVGFAQADLSLAQWAYVSFKGLDVSQCTITGWKVDPKDLYGLRVSALQAVELCQLLGLEIGE